MQTRTLYTEEYFFKPSEGVIKFKVDDLEFQNIIMIVNQTLNNTTIYNFACEDYGGTFDVNSLTFNVDVSLMNSTDRKMQKLLNSAVQD